MIEIHPTPETAAAAVARQILGAGEQALEQGGRFCLVLAGGATYRSVYAQFAEMSARLPWDWRRVHLFWGDERGVLPEHPDSNYRLAWQAWLHALPIPPANLHRLRGELPPAQAARWAERSLREFFEGAPAFDLILLGMGEDGHTASLFPGDPWIEASAAWVLPVRHDRYPPPLVDRITLTPAILNRGEQVLILATGAAKADTVRRALRGPFDPASLPVQAIQPASGRLAWHLDQPAAGRLED